MPKKRGFKETGALRELLVWPEHQGCPVLAPLLGGLDVTPGLSACSRFGAVEKSRNTKNNTSRRNIFPKAATVLSAIKYFPFFHSNSSPWFLSFASRAEARLTSRASFVPWLDRCPCPTGAAAELGLGTT